MKLLRRVQLAVTPWTVACTRLLCPWGFPGKSTGVGCHFLFQGIFPTQRSNPGLPHCRQTLYHLSHQVVKGEKERYTHLNAEFQRIARRDKKAFLISMQTEENNRMGKSRDLIKKIRDTKGIFHARSDQSFSRVRLFATP